jgi:hypothetical protein
MTRLSLTALPLLLLAATAAGDEKKDMPGTTAKEGASVSDTKKEKVLKDIARKAEPVAEHKRLDPLVGKWTTTSKLWWGGKKPEQATGHAEANWILGGRFVEEHYDSVMWGKPYAGTGVIGFDTRSKKYVSTWIDTWGTWITEETGSMDKDGKVLTLTADDYDETGAKTRPIKFVYTIDGNDHHIMRVYEVIQGKETLTMEVDYRKAK